jgi:UDP-4-amino-4-deoxy-L-arabinose formyltransferase/UDP-glucuronic acid dehydrogenase (UDP-4-keto-hexauronic acid decarboxylating)
VQNINGYPFGANDLVIGFGTSLITASTLASLRHGFLNLHTGWLPDYRGVKSEYWTLARGDVERAGWTLHYMTPRIDDGDIVLQRTVRVENDTAPQLRARLLEDAVPELVDFIAMVRRRGFDAIPRRAQEHGRYFTTPTWRHWLKTRKSRQVAT